MDITSINDPSIFNGNGINMLKPRYEYEVKIIEQDDEGKVFTEIQNGIKANSDKDLSEILFLSGIQKFQIMNRKEINPPTEENKQKQLNTKVVPQTQISESIKPQQSEEPKYFSTGGMDFKIVGNEMFVKQWVLATPEECKKIRIVNDKTNKIINLPGKHIEIQQWIKIDSNDALSD